MIVDVDRDTRGRLAWLALVVALGALGLGLLIPIAAWVAFNQLSTPARVSVAIVYMVVVVFTHVTRHHHTFLLAAEIDTLLNDLRTALFNRIRRSELPMVESLGSEDNSTRDIERFANATAVLIDAIRLVFSLLSRCFYVLSLSGFGAVLFGAMGVVITRASGRKIRASQDASASYSDACAATDRALSHVQEGFAQLRLDPVARQGLLADLNEASAARADHQHRFDKLAREMQLSAYMILTMGLGVLLLADMPEQQMPLATRGELLSMMFFILPSVLFILREASLGTRIRDAWRRTAALIERLGPPPEPRTEARAGFERLCLKQVAFQYPERDFALGPIDLTLHAGELMFVVGGNGSGKTTLFKVLTGLYPPTAGHIEVDGEVLSYEGASRGEQRARKREALRSLCSAVFADHHLFDRLYGLDLAEGEVDAMLDRFGLGGIVRVEGDRFERLELSSGQSKRLALVVALLEKRPLVVLDEWAAHQDPAMRRWYYTELLPELKAQGRTVIAITHDDRYFDIADHVVRLDGGRASVLR